LLSLIAPVRQVGPAGRYLRTLIDRLVGERLSRPESDDLFSLLRRAEGSTGGPVSEQLKDDVVTLFVAGHDTIAIGLTWTFHLLASHPAAEVLLQDELRSVLGDNRPEAGHLGALGRAGGVFAEALRLYPPSWVITRRALESHQVAGTLVPAGALVIVSQYLLHRDARFFSDPLVFDPRRWEEADQQTRPRLSYFPFGAGPRSCIGQGLATLEGVLALARIAARWRLTPAGRAECDPRATLRPKGPVMMKVARK
jgi:cytochrome P450